DQPAPSPLGLKIPALRQRETRTMPLIVYGSRPHRATQPRPPHNWMLSFKINEVLATRGAAAALSPRSASHPGRAGTGIYVPLLALSIPLPPYFEQETHHDREPPCRCSARASAQNQVLHSRRRPHHVIGRPARQSRPA